MDQEQISEAKKYSKEFYKQHCWGWAVYVSVAGYVRYGESVVQNLGRSLTAKLLLSSQMFMEMAWMLAFKRLLPRLQVIVCVKKV